MASELDPQVEALLAQFRANAARQPTRELTVREKVAASRTLSAFAPFAIAAEEVAAVENFEIRGGGGPIPVRVYVPETHERPANGLPVLVYYHGGSFTVGGLDSHDTLTRALANRGACIVVSVAYRLAPEHPYPAANHDAWRALTWAAAHAFEIGGDRERLAIGGDSAGGLLAAWVAQEARAQDLPVRLQLLLYPNLDCTASMPSWTTLGSGAYLLSHADMLARLDLYLPQDVDRADAAVSPLFATELAGIAPAFLVVGDHDPLRDEDEAYSEKLKAAGVAVDYTLWPGMIHGFASFAGVVDAGKALIDRAGTALRRAFLD